MKTLHRIRTSLAPPRFYPPRAWRVLLWGLLTCCEGLWLTTASASEPVVLTGRDGRQATLTLQGTTAESLRIVEGPQTRKWSSAERLRWPLRTARPLDAGTSCRLTLVGGDTFYGTPLAADSDRWKWRLEDCWEGWIPISEIARVEQPPGFRVLAVDDFEQPETDWRATGALQPRPMADQHHSGSQALAIPPTSETVSAPLPADSAVRRISVWFWDPGPAAQGLWHCRATGGHADRSISVAITLTAPEPRYRLIDKESAGWSQQTLARHAGWQQLTLATSASQLLILINNQLLASCKLPGGSWREVTFQNAGGTESLWLDDWLVLSGAGESAPATPATDVDVLQLETGEELFGTCEWGDWPQLRFEGTSRNAIPWSQCRCLSFAPRSRQPTPTTGWQIVLHPAPRQGDARGNERVIHAACVGLTSDALSLQHPVLGTIDWPVKQVQSLQPRFFGTSWLLLGRPVHLGDEIRAGWQQPIPAGTHWSGEVNLSEFPAGRARLQLQVAELEPAGKLTPARLPQRARIGTRQLISCLNWNDRELDTLNRHVHAAHPSQRPARLQFPIPRKQLEVGRNLVQIRLVPDRSSIPEYDDWELQRVELEFEPDHR